MALPPSSRRLVALRLLPLAALLFGLGLAAPAAATDGYGHDAASSASDPSGPQPSGLALPGLAPPGALAECVPRGALPGGDPRSPLRRDLRAERAMAAPRPAPARVLPDDGEQASTAPRSHGLARWCLGHSTATSFA